MLLRPVGQAGGQAATAAADTAPTAAEQAWLLMATAAADCWCPVAVAAGPLKHPSRTPAAPVVGGVGASGGVR